MRPELEAIGPTAGHDELPRVEKIQRPEAKTRPPECCPLDDPAAITEVLQQIQAVRKRPLFALVADPIDERICEKVYGWRRELRAAREGHEQLDILIHSPGGDLTSCYVVARLFSRYMDEWEALVPVCATSGATLICLGSSNVVMSEIAQLGPVDPQVLSKRREKFFEAERQSPLEAFQAMRYLREVSVASLDACMLFLIEQGVAAQPALENATKMAANLVQPILAKIDPYDLGAFSLDASVALNYCGRIAQPADVAKKTQREADYKALVETYPAHEFFIDLAEARALKFKATEATGVIEDLFDVLRPSFEGLHYYIGLVPVQQEANP